MLRFVVIKRKIGEFMDPWVIPQQEEFDHIINEATQNALSTDALSSFAWADSKRGNVALYAESRMAMELFREVLRSVQAPDPLFQYETYLRESILQRYSLTVLLKPNLANNTKQQPGSYPPQAQPLPWLVGWLFIFNLTIHMAT